MSQIHFKPWIGHRYEEAPLGTKIMILGEAHYDWEEGKSINADPELTNVLIQEQIDGDYTKAFWTNIAATFLNHKPRLEEKGEFWHSVAFYNYVQASVGFGPRVAPSSEQWTSSESAFFEVLEALRPKLLVILGYRLWDRTPSTNCESAPKIAGEEHVTTCRYIYSGDSCFCVSLRHPSSGFSSSKWHSAVRGAIQMAQRDRLS